METPRRFPLSFLATTLFILGCGTAPTPPQATSPPAAEHDHGHEHGHETQPHAPGDWVATVQELTKLQGEIKAAFAAEKGADADSAVHEIGHLLEDLEGMVGKTITDPAAKTEVIQSIQALFEAFGKIDAKLHGGAGASYAEVSEQIESAMAILAKQAPIEKAAP
jgi:hypothetical protein